MNRNAIVLILATIMVFSSLAVAMNSSIASNSHQFQAAPDSSAAKTVTGNVYIYANGTVSNSSAVQQVGGTNTYELLANVNGTLFVQRNDTAVNGNGLTLTGGSTFTSNGAFMSSDTADITLENAVVGATSYYGIEMANVASAQVLNVSTKNFTGNTLMSFSSSGNITVEGGNFSFSSAYYGILAEEGSSLDVSNSMFTGICTYFVEANTVGQFNALNNTIAAGSSSQTYGLYFYGGNAVIANNSVSGAEYAIYANGAHSVETMDNHITNASYGFFVENVISYLSHGDKTLFGNNPVYLQDNGNVTFQGDTFSNYTSNAYIYYNGQVSFLNSIFNSSVDGIYLEGTSSLNVTGDVFNLGQSSSVRAIFGQDSSGVVVLKNDFISAPNGTGLFYEEGSPQLSVFNSYFNTYFGIYMSTGNSVYSANNILVKGNTFAGIYQYAPVDLYVYSASDIRVLNNTMYTTGSYFGSYGVDINPIYGSSNITVDGNSIKNFSTAIEVYNSNIPGDNTFIKNNHIVNTNNGIYGYSFANSVVSSNTVLNVSNYGIYVDAGTLNTIVTNNTVENFPGYGPMFSGIYLDFLGGGNNILSHNSVINPGSSANAIYVYNAYPLLIYANTVNGGGTGIYIYGSTFIGLFGNTVSNASYGIYSDEDNNYSFYGNTVSNANYSFYSFYDYNGVVFANTFSDSQANASQLYFLYLEHNYGPITFYHNNFINSTTNSKISNYIYASNAPLAMNEGLPIGGNFWSNYTGTGANGIGNTPMNVTGTAKDIYPLLHRWASPTVTFVESGLPSGTQWSVELGSMQLAGNSTSVVFQDTSGQYMTASYNVMSVPGYRASASAGTLYMNGGSSVVTVDFAPVTYAVAFNESGLASGTSWSVTVNGNTQTSTGTGIAFDLANGTYDYTLGAVSGYSNAGTNGTFSVNGAAKSFSAAFLAVDYTLKVNETGLPAGTTWNLSVGGKSYNATGTSFMVELPAGNYNISVVTPAGYTVTLSSQNITVGPGNATLLVVFSANKSSVTSPASLYGRIGSAAVVGGAIGTLSTMFYTGTGIFRKLRGPKTP